MFEHRKHKTLNRLIVCFLVAVFSTAVVLSGWCAGEAAANRKKPGQKKIFRPEQFGAKGDGINDDSKYIQMCIDKASKVPEDEQGRKGTVALDSVYYVTRQVIVIDDTTSEQKLKVGPHWRVFHVPDGVTITGKGTVTLLQNGQSSRKNPCDCTYVFYVTAFPKGRIFTPGYKYGDKPVSLPLEEKDCVRNVTISGITVLNDPAGLLPRYSESTAINVVHGINVHVNDVKMRHWHRGIRIANSVRSSITNCFVEDSRYIGIAMYSFDYMYKPILSRSVKENRNKIESNRVIGNTLMACGIYAEGEGTRVIGNTVHFAMGIWCENYSNALVNENRISRSPVPIRIGYRGSFGGYERTHDVTVSNNFITDSVSGIMVHGGKNIIVVNNTLQNFVELGGDWKIEPPRGYWGYGRERVGINVEDGDNVSIVGNTISGLSTGTPAGIRAVNSIFTTDFDSSPYVLSDKNDPEDVDWNSDITIKGNSVEAKSGLRIGYYIENQKNFIFEGNQSSGCSGNRIISSTGRLGKNKLDSPMCVVKMADAKCRRLVMKSHPIHPEGLPYGRWKFSSPPPEYNEYFPPIKQGGD